MSVMSQCYSIIINWGISSLGHGKEVVYGLNDVDKCYIYINWCTMFNFLDQTDLIPRCKFPLATKKDDVSLTKEFQHHMTKEHCKHGVFDQRKTINYSRKENVQTYSIMFRIMLMFHKKMWKFIVTKINSQHYHLVAHITKLTVQGGRVSMIICVLIQN